MPLKRTSTSEAPAMTQAAIKKLVADSVSIALEAQAANMENTDNTTRPREAHVAKNWNSFAQPIGIEEAYKITWVKFKKLLIKKYCPRTEFQKMEYEFYHLTVKGNDLKTYVRRFQELATLCPTMVLDSEKMIKVFIGGLHQSHLTKNCKNKGPATRSNLLPVTVTCHACIKKGHYANQCRKTTNNNAQGRAYMLRDMNAQQDPNVVTVMEKKLDEKRLEDIPIVREFPKVFPEDHPWPTTLSLRTNLTPTTRVSRSRFYSNQYFTLGDPVLLCQKERQNLS
ncbi:reverse transcriptase domain-containing protein [Tanacetum coccineum]